MPHRLARTFLSGPSRSSSLLVKVCSLAKTKPNAAAATCLSVPAYDRLMNRWAV